MQVVALIHLEFMPSKGYKFFYSGRPNTSNTSNTLEALKHLSYALYALK